MADETTPDQDALVRAGIQAAIDVDDPGTMVLRWVVVAEVANSEGQRRLWRFGAHDMAVWDAWGMLAYATLPWGEGNKDG